MNGDGVPQPPSTSRHVRRPAPRCGACGYDVRGIGSDLCPECGSLINARRLRFLNADDLRIAIAALEQAGIRCRIVEPAAAGNMAALITGGLPACHELWMAAGDLHRAIDVMDEAGAAAPLPLVDPLDPACPECGAAVPANGEPVCPTCHAPFTWIESDGEPASTPVAPPTEPGPIARRETKGNWVSVGAIALGAASLFAGALAATGGFVAGLTMAAIGALLLLGGFARIVRRAS